MIFAQYSIKSCVYPSGFRRCPFGCSAGPCRCRMSVPWLVRLGETQESVVRVKSVRNLPPAMQLSFAFFQFSVCSYDFCLVQHVIVRVPLGFEVPLSDAVRACADAVRALEQPTVSLALKGTHFCIFICKLLWGKYRACRTHKKYGRHLGHARLSKGPKSTESHL